MSNYESPERQWFALHDDGTITALGDCGDYQVADEIAQDMGINPMWLVNPEMAKQWADIFKSRGVY